MFFLVDKFISVVISTTIDETFEKQNNVYYSEIIFICEYVNPRLYIYIYIYIYIYNHVGSNV